MMQYKPIIAIWEITNQCNMTCKHCFSDSQRDIQSELTTEEALKLCDGFAELGFEWVTLSGGEPLLRADWPLIAERLTQNGIHVKILSNGYFVDDQVLEQVTRLDIKTFIISLDGLEQSHDSTRKAGSFKRAVQAIDILSKKRNLVGVSTTIHKTNLKDLHGLKDLLIEKGVKLWQLQYAIPFGSMASNGNLMIEPQDVNEIIQFAYDANQEGKIDIRLTDCLGYYDMREIALRYQNPSGVKNVWKGCSAGKYTLGVHSNGDVYGCISLRHPSFMEGNIKEKSLKQIWEDAKSFDWNRSSKKENIEGLCGKCQFGSYCLGGCSAVRFSVMGSLYKENKYCLFNMAVSKSLEDLSQIQDTARLWTLAKDYFAQNNFQLADALFTRLLEADSENAELLALRGYASYKLENFRDALVLSKRILKSDPQNPQAHHCLGLTLCRTGDVEAGLLHLRKSVELSHDGFTDSIYDLSSVLLELGKQDEACAVLEEGRCKYPDFVEKSQALYDKMRKY